MWIWAKSEACESTKNSRSFGCACTRPEATLRTIALTHTLLVTSAFSQRGCGECGECGQQQQDSAREAAHFVSVSVSTWQRRGTCTLTAASWS